MPRVYAIKDLKDIQDILYHLEVRNPTHYLMAVTGLYTGLRISDILRLRVRDVKGKSFIRVKQKKTGHYIDIKINAELQRDYKKHLVGRTDNEYLIKSREGENKPLTRQACWKILSDLGKKYGTRQLGTHSLRKSYGRIIYNNFGIGVTQKALGHKTEYHTKDYIDILDDEVIKAVESIKIRKRKG